MDSKKRELTDDEKQALFYIGVAEEAINIACVVAVDALREAGDESPVYSTAAGVFAVMVKTVTKFHEHAGYSKEEAVAKTREIMAPLGKVIDDIYVEGHDKSNQYMPPISLN